MSRIRATVRISGQVQGVSFRYHTRETARKHNVTGWVKNLADGDVAAVFEGQEDDVRRVLDWCHSGPAAARVDNLNVEVGEFRDEYSSFTISY